MTKPEEKLKELGYEKYGDLSENEYLYVLTYKRAFYLCIIIKNNKFIMSCIVRNKRQKITSLIYKRKAEKLIKKHTAILEEVEQCEKN